MKRIFLIALFFALCGADNLSAQLAVSGRVFVDRNGNGVCDWGEKRLRGVAVSDGDTVVLTSVGGRYSFESNNAENIFVVAPRNYTTSATRISNPRGVSGGDLALLRRPTPDRFKALFVGDVHVEDSTMLDYAERSIFKYLSDGAGADFNVWLGDVVNESPEWIAPMAERIEVLPNPSWVAIGNHDYDKNRKDAPSTAFESAFGLKTYAFHYGRTCFVVIESPHNEASVRFLKNLLSVLPDDECVVLCLHYPLTYKSYNHIVEMLDQRECPSLIMTAHHHTVERAILGRHTSHVVVGSVCAIWWRGWLDDEGLPLPYMQCGSLRNVYEAEFDGTDFRLHYRPLRNEGQMRVWIAGSEPSDQRIKDLAEVAPGMVVVNVFGAGEDAQVSMSIDSAEPVKMSYSPMTDPEVLRLRQISLEANFSRKDPRRTVYRRADSPHIWQLMLPDDLATGTHIITITATDSRGLNAQYSVEYVKE